MPGMQELLSRLQQLETGYYGDKEAARQQQFLDTYGARFSNNRGLGLAILNELDARGIDTSAADEAVGQILDTLRTECNEIIESIKEVQADAIENAQKVEAIQNVVSEAASANPDGSLGGDLPTTEGLEVPPDEGINAMNPDAEFDPSMVGGEEEFDQSMIGGEEEGAQSTQQEQVIPEEGEQSSAEEESQDVLSDARKKRIKRMKDNWGKTLTMKKREQENNYKPSKNILQACGGDRC